MNIEQGTRTKEFRSEVRNKNSKFFLHFLLPFEIPCSLFLVLYSLFLPNTSFSQLKWTKIDTGYGKLPWSIQLFKTTDSLNGHPFIAMYALIDLKDRQLELTTQIGDGKRYTPQQYHYLEKEPYIVVNGTFFSFQTNQNLNLVMKNGEILAYNVPALKSPKSDSFYYPTRSAIGFTRTRRPDVAWIFTDSAERWPYAFQERPIVARGATSDPTFTDLRTIDFWRWWKKHTAIGGGPVLVKDAAVLVTNKEEQMFVNGDNDRHPRTAMGYTSDKKLIILMVQGRFPGIADGATLNEEAKILVDLGCEEGLNLDGGGSSCMLVNGNETIKPSDKEGQRAVPAVFIVRARKKGRN
jgi:hypothetical protein